MSVADLHRAIMSETALAQDRQPETEITKIVQLGNFEVVMLLGLVKKYGRIQPGTFDENQGPPLSIESLNRFLTEIFFAWTSAMGVTNTIDKPAPRTFSGTHVKVGTFIEDLPLEKKKRAAGGEQTDSARRANADAYFGITLSNGHFHVTPMTTDKNGLWANPTYVRYDENIDGYKHAYRMAIENYDANERVRITNFNRASCIHAARSMIVEMSRRGLGGIHEVAQIDPPVLPLHLARHCMSQLSILCADVNAKLKLSTPTAQEWVEPSSRRNELREDQL